MGSCSVCQLVSVDVSVVRKGVVCMPSMWWVFDVMSHGHGRKGGGEH